MDTPESSVHQAPASDLQENQPRMRNIVYTLSQGHSEGSIPDSRPGNGK